MLALIQILISFHYHVNVLSCKVLKLSYCGIHFKWETRDWSCMFAYGDMICIKKNLSIILCQLCRPNNKSIYGIQNCSYVRKCLLITAYNCQLPFSLYLVTQWIFFNLTFNLHLLMAMLVPDQVHNFFAERIIIYYFRD